MPQIGVNSVFSDFAGFFEGFAKGVDFWNRRHDHVEATAGLRFEKYGAIVFGHWEQEFSFLSVSPKIASERPQTSADVLR